MEDEDSRTVYCGNIAEEVTEELLYELFLQVAPVDRISIPQDRGGRKPNFAFIIFKHQDSVPYVVRLLDGISLFNKRLNIKTRSKNANNSPAVRPPIPNGTVILMPNYFQTLLDMPPYAPATSYDHTSVVKKMNDSRNNRGPRDNRRDERKPYGRNDRHRNADWSYENNRRSRF